MWLPDFGSLHTVVLFTPGKWAASDLFAGLAHPYVCRLLRAGRVKQPRTGDRPRSG